MHTLADWFLTLPSPPAEAGSDTGAVDLAVSAAARGDLSAVDLALPAAC